ncbi:MAG: hypothetical protein A2Y62_07500 [Candidatus Fischerbacteria bacterium RBG_13_37_8]|uniref:Response regulatory domain-containing protein n=1 Tax=Candidatus Fischerbacteria bacterium RBG_13_37_8 TaxID=1817863 RepID=A0A1F5VIH6_9BACT|nr:MAG: hypothetical protein A2Y62_07500 [Candidatus Fischerbacteria bacterium RBG_13_37_8]
MRGKVAIISEDKNLVNEMIPFYRRCYLDICSYHKCDDGLNAVLNEAFDLVMLDYEISSGNTMDILKKIRKNHPNISIIALFPAEGTATSQILELLEKGVFHYFKKPVDSIEELVLYSNKAIEICSLRKEYNALVQEILFKEEQEASIDEETGLFSYATFLYHMKMLAKRSSKTALPVSVIFIGIHEYDELLKKEGEAFISELISHVGMKIAKNLRSSDIKGYLENGVYIIGIEGGDIACALHVSEKLKRIIASANATILDRETMIHINAGAASLVLCVQDDLESLLDAANKSYEKARQKGPGWIELYSEEE